MRAESAIALNAFSRSRMGPKWSEEVNARVYPGRNSFCKTTIGRGRLIAAGGTGNSMTPADAISTIFSVTRFGKVAAKAPVIPPP